MSSRIFTVPAILSRVAYLKDKGLSLGFSTQEMTDEEKVIVSKFHGEFGYLAFKENEIKPDDIPPDEASDGRKSQSKRLRDVMFVWWKQLGSKGDFQSFYNSEMDKAIERYKQLLD